MPRNKVLAILFSILACTIAYVLWQKLEPPKVGPGLNGAGGSGAASSSPSSTPKLGKLQQ